MLERGEDVEEFVMRMDVRDWCVKSRFWVKLHFCSVALQSSQHVLKDLGAAAGYSLICNRREMLIETNECNSAGCLCQVI